MSRAHERTLQLRSGRSIMLRELRQLETYEGLMMGHPMSKENERHIERLVDEYRREPYPGAPYVIRPVQTPIEVSNPSEVERRALAFVRDRHGVPASIPPITCIGRFVSFSVARDQREDASVLVVIWFQDAWALPIDPGVLADLLAIDWDEHATDFSW